MTFICYIQLFALFSYNFIDIKYILHSTFDFTIHVVVKYNGFTFKRNCKVIVFTSKHLYIFDCTYGFVVLPIIQKLITIVNKALKIKSNFKALFTLSVYFIQIFSILYYKTRSFMQVFVNCLTFINFNIILKIALNKLRYALLIKKILTSQREHRLDR